MDYLGSNVRYVPPPRKKYVPPPIAKKAPAPVVRRQPPIVQQQPRQKATPPPVARTQQQPSAFKDGWDEFLEPSKIPQQAARNVAPQPRARQAIGAGAISGPGINGWTRQGNTATSPAITLQRGVNHQLSLLWRLENVRRSPNEFFRIYAIDTQGGRKLLLNQVAADIAEVGSYDQLYEENINRYIGPPVQIMFETSPGLKAFIERLTY
jgi:hypothetical protein